MSNPTRDELIVRLIDEFGFPSQGAALIADKLLDLQPVLKLSFEEWWKTGRLPDLKIEGYSLGKLMSDHGMKTVAAFLTLDWLLREPERAKASLKRGHDFVNRG